MVEVSVVSEIEEKEILDNEPEVVVPKPVDPATTEEKDEDYSDVNSSDEESEEKKISTKNVGSDADDDEEEDDSSDDDEDEYDDEEDILNETIGDRIIALKAIVPPKYRYQAQEVGSSVASVVKSVFSFSSSALWVITTSSLLLGVPLTLSVISEQQLMEMEKEMKLTQSTNEVLAPGAESGFQQAPAVAV